MKKYFLLGLIIAIAPNVCFGAGARYTQLVREKQRKMEELEKCMGSTKGLQIAGVSTLGLTAVGVAGNLAEAKQIKEYENYIENAPKEIAKIQKQIDEANAELAKKDEKKGNKAESTNGLITDPKEQEERLKLYRDNCIKTEGQLVDGSCVCKEGFSDSWDGTCVSDKISSQADNCYTSGGDWDTDYEICKCADGYTVDDDGSCQYIEIEFSSPDLKVDQI